MGVALIMSRPFGNIGIKTEETKRTENFTMERYSWRMADTVINMWMS